MFALQGVQESAHNVAYKALQLWMGTVRHALDSMLHPHISTLTFCMMPDALKWRCASREASL